MNKDGSISVNFADVINEVLTSRFFSACFGSEKYRHAGVICHVTSADWRSHFIDFAFRLNNMNTRATSLNIYALKK